MNQVNNSEALIEFKERIHALGLLPLWDRQVKLVPGSDCVVAHWPYQQMRPLLDEATRLITKKDAERRVLVMENPSLRGTSFIANSLFAGQQIILPGEFAFSHRHTPNALRFLVEGAGAYTSIDGHKIPMSPGDFVVTPSWSWHDHGNEGEEAVVWMDGLDTPFTSLFGAHFRENYSAQTFPLKQLPVDQVQPLIFPFKKISAILKERSNDKSLCDPAHGFKYVYSNEVSGEFAFKTMAAFMQLLPSNFAGSIYRTTESSVFNVAQGSCYIDMEDQTLHLQEHDVVVIPSWKKYQFRSSQNCMLFSFSDRAAQKTLGFWQEEYLTK